MEYMLTLSLTLTDYEQVVIFAFLFVWDEGTGVVSEDEMLHCYVKNSTLLSFSDAVNIGMQHPPNLSSILGIIMQTMATF